ncbi:hypothetical protein GGR92_004765 [Spirosoma lacussanchae]|uniref:Uncharacterized protein n=1 Tax=Spirosoma sordidisoli TaxID=2502893 RepID=A0A4Q2ULH3_9BACT|nr:MULTISPECIES: hypothetical protein [Spirosoma]RYC67689.1 hypothetical protein EQG79_23590 [Spirosoma sordidisoli]
MKRVTSVVVLAVSILSLASCDYQKYNTIRQSDYRQNDPYVYGPGKDSAAVQSKYKYTPNPALEGRTQKIREKLFGAGTIGEGA